MVVEDNIVPSALSTSSVLVVEETEGYSQVTHKIMSGQFNLIGCHVLFMLVGRFDVLDRSLAVEPKLHQLQLAVGRVDSSIIIVLCTPLPRGLDDVNITRKLFRTGFVLRLFCQGKGRLEFCRLGSSFTTPKGIKQEWFNRQHLNRHGWDVLQEGILAKVQSATLRERSLQFHEALNMMR